MCVCVEGEFADKIIIIISMRRQFSGLYLVSNQVRKRGVGMRGMYIHENTCV